MRRSQPFSLRQTVALLIGLLTVWCGTSIQSEKVYGAATIDEVQIGFAGAHKTGFWTPVRVAVTAADAPISCRLEIRSRDGAGLEVRSRGAEGVSIPARQTVTLEQYVKIGRSEKGLTVEVHIPNQPVIQKRVSFSDQHGPTAPNAQLIVSLGGDIGVADALTQDASVTGIASVLIEASDQLPLEWYGYEGVDTIVLTTHDNPLLDALSLKQTTAIGQWVEMGGQLVICSGESGEQFLQVKVDSPRRPLVELVPGSFANIATVGNSAALENYTGGGQALRINPDRRLHMTTLENVEGNLELYDVGVNGRRPMVIRAPFGFGQVVFVAFDLDQPPLSEWEGRSRMVVKVIRGAFAHENRTAAQQQSGQVSHVGYHDMVGQLRGALDQFDEVSFVAFSIVATLILLYILLIGPLDYFLLKNVLGRMQLTWITFPAIVLGFVVLALVLKTQLKSSEILVNQVDLIDVDSSTGLLRGTTWAHIYSPVTETYDVAVEPLVTRDVDASTNSLISWQGMPGAGLGGLNSTSTAATFTEPYTLTTGQAEPLISGLPIQVASTTSISSRWWQKAAWEHATSLHADSDDLLEGVVINPLEVELHDCMIFYSVWAYHLERTRGRLKPGQTARAEDERPRNLQWRLTRREVQEMKDVATPWDPTSFDVPRIMELMMFQQVAGGDQYTKLTHRYQQYVDLSAHLDSGRAVLVGRIEEQGSRVTVDGQPIDSKRGRHWTYCRIVFPVDRANSRNK